VELAPGWWRELRRVAWVLLPGLLLGWLLDAVAPVLIACVLGLLLFWLVQLRRVAGWLVHSDSEPPEAGGLWGDLFDGIYHLKRHDREERDRLQTTVSYLRDSFAALKDAAIMIDASGAIEWSNEAAASFLGLQYPRDRGQAILNLLRIPVFHSYFTEGDFSIPLVIESPQNGELRLLIEITPFGKGNRLMFARDVTKMERLEEMRRDFVANVSHELRTPLTVITGYLHTLSEMELDPEGRLEKPLFQMRQQAERMESLLKDLLWLSRVESVRDNAEQTDIDMTGLLNEVREEALLSAPGRAIRLSVDSEARLRGNYKQLYSAVSNLVFNALKYSDQDVHVSWVGLDDRLCLSVTDRGPGIDPMHLPRLTERFYRVDRSRSQETGGTGLGLAIVKHVLAGHGARLEIDSQPGEGSTFRCVFPLS
jgi:two-component system phosphate regulon sensor histidine kinase PhoR